MNEILRNELCTYLGELKQEYETTHDWIEKEELGSKINAIEFILNVRKTHKTFSEHVISIYKKLGI